MALNGATAGEAVRSYLGTLAERERTAQQNELARFARWVGSAVRLDTLKAEDIERYQEQVEQSGADPKRLEPVRVFLAAVHKSKLTELNLSKYIRIKRAASKKGKDAKAETLVEDDSVEMTAEGHESLKTELDHLVNVKRAEIAQDLYEARIDKDFRENAPFDAAKQHQAEVENRIRLLERTLATARIVDQGANGSRVGLGSKVLLTDMTHGDELSYTLVGTSEANPRLGRISIASPVGRALIDHSPGDEFEIEAPGGTVRYRVDQIES
jgi:transcription elongation factor GreA